MLIDIIIKSIAKSIVYLSFQYDTSISFMIAIQYYRFDMVYIPTYTKGNQHVLHTNIDKYQPQSVI